MKVSKLYNLWLKARHLPSDGCQVEIESVAQEELFARPGAPGKIHLVLSFKNASRRLILNGGNANRLADVSDDTDDWPGVVVSLTPSKWAGKDTIILSPVVNGNGKN